MLYFIVRPTAGLENSTVLSAGPCARAVEAARLKTTATIATVRCAMDFMLASLLNVACPLILLILIDFHSRPTQNAFHTVVALVAGVLEHQVAGPVERRDTRPGLRPHGGIAHGELVADRVGVAQRQPLDHMEVLVGSPVPAAELIPRPVVETLALDDERVALPVAPRLARPIRGPSAVRGGVRFLAASAWAPGCAPAPAVNIRSSAPPIRRREHPFITPNSLFCVDS